MSKIAIHKPMVFVGFVKKINSELFKKIQMREDTYWLNGKEIYNCEICGVVLNTSGTTILICDFFGKIEIMKKPDLLVEDKGPYVFSLKLYSKKNKVYAFCKNLRKVSIYEEVAFNLEVKRLIETFCC